MGGAALRQSGQHSQLCHSLKCKSLHNLIQVPTWISMSCQHPALLKLRLLKPGKAQKGHLSAQYSLHHPSRLYDCNVIFST